MKFLVQWTLQEKADNIAMVTFTHMNGYNSQECQYYCTCKSYNKGLATNLWHFISITHSHFSHAK